MTTEPKAATAPGEHPSDPALHLVIALHRLVRALRQAPDTPSLHPTQLLVLAQLVDTGPLRIGELAGRVPCSQPTATTVVSGLEAAGLVRRIPDAADGRAIRVRLTELGRATLMSMAHGEAELLRRRLAELDEQDRATVLAAAPILQRMSQPS